MVTSLPQNELCLSLLRCACPCWAVGVFVTLWLSLLRCACLSYAVPVRVGLWLSLLLFAWLCYVVLVLVGVCLSLLRCACPCWGVPVFVTLWLTEFSCDGPCVCLSCLETEYWPWFPFIEVVVGELTRWRNDRLPFVRARDHKSFPGQGISVIYRT